jgi:hypothetical protein
MKNTFRLQLEVDVEADDKEQMAIVEQNIKLIPEMADTLNLYTNGADATVIKATNTVKRITRRRKRTPKTAAA